MIAERRREPRKVRRPIPASAPVGAVESVRQQVPGPMAHRGAVPIRRVKQFAWRSREAAAVVVASFCVTLLCLYVAAYARVTAEGFDVSRLGRKVRALEAEEQSLQADVSKLRSPEKVRERALEMGMISGAPAGINLVTQKRASAVSTEPTSTTPTP